MFRSNPNNKMGSIGSVGGCGVGTGNPNQIAPNQMSNDGLGAFPPPEPPNQTKVILFLNKMTL